MQSELSRLLSFLSSPPEHREYYIGTTEGSKWVSRCIKEVLPALSEYIEKPTTTAREAALVVQAICKAYKYPGMSATADFQESTWSLMERSVDIAGEAALVILCESISTNRNTSFDWSRAVSFLQDRKCKEVAPLAVLGLLNRYKHRRFVDQFNEAEVNVAIEAIHSLDLQNRQELIRTFLSLEDELFKKMVIRALGSYGDYTSLRLLKKRLGGLLFKPERDSFVRQLIKNSIEEIKMRDRK